MPSDLIQYLIIGSYLFGAASWLFLYKEIRQLHFCVEALKEELAFARGREKGLDLDTRLTRLERQQTTLYHHFTGPTASGK